MGRRNNRFGASFIGADISENQIAAARRLSAGMDIQYIVSAAEEVSFPDNSFDSVLACQCFWYFDKPVLLPRLAGMLKPKGRFGILSLGWLPEECEIARKSEELVLRYNPAWSGGGFTRSIPQEPDWLNGLFSVGDICCFDLPVRFTRESWDGRMRACRGIGATLPPDEVDAFSAEHLDLLRATAPKEFEIPHYATMLILKVIK